MTQQQPEPSGKLYQQILENYPNAFISVINRDFTVGYSSGGEFTKRQIDPADFIGKRLEDVFGDMTLIVRSYLEKTFEGQLVDFELFFNDQYMMYRTVPLTDQDGAVRFILVAVENITEQKKNDLSLKDSEERYRLLFEKSTDPILIIDGSTFIDCNTATAEFLHFNHVNQVIGKTPWDLSPNMQPDGKSSRTKAIEMISLAKEKGYHRFEWVHVNAIGEERWLDISLTHLTIEGNTRIYTVWRDITERKQVEEELRKYREHLETLVADRTRELEEKNRELERFNSLFVGREFRIKELRDQVKELKKKLDATDR